MMHANSKMFCLKTLPAMLQTGLARHWAGTGMAGALMLASSQLAAASQPAEPLSPTMAGGAAAEQHNSAAALASKESPEEQFDSNILKARGLQPELSHYFRQAARFSAGKNIIDVVVNGAPLGRKTAFFSSTGSLCFTPLFLQSVGLVDGSKLEGASNNNNSNTSQLILPTPSDQLRTDVNTAPGDAQQAPPFASRSQALPDAEACPGPEVVSAQTVVTLSPSQVSADITTPAQTVTTRPLARMEQGGSAAMINYRASTFTSTAAGGNTNRFTQVDSQVGFNWNDWIVRSNQSYSNQNGQSHVRFANAYAQKTFVAEKHIFQGGLTSTQSPIYGGIPILGAQWFPETALRAQSKYAVTGIAATRARVVITQNGVILLSTVVPPGPFRLTDYPQGNRTGDFQVQVIEATGAEQRFTIASSDVLLAEGNAIEEGIYASAGLLSNVGAVNGQYSVPVLTLEKGWRYSGKTAFSTGALATNKYASAGVAVTSQAEMAGPLSVYAQAQVARNMRDGATGMLVSTSIGWRYLEQLQVGASAVARTAQYRSAQEAQAQLAPLFGPPQAATHLQMGGNISWNAGQLGSFSASATRQTLFAAPASNTYALGWSMAVGRGQLGITLARTQQGAAPNAATGPSNQSVFVNFYMPLGFDATLTSNFQQTNNSGVLRSVVASSVSQRVNDALSYQVAVEKPLSETSGDTKNISVSAVPRYTSVTVGAGSAPGANSYFAQASGGVIISNQGAAFAPNPIQDTFAMVKLGDVAGVQLNTPQGTVWSGFNGLTAVPGLTPFASSTVEVVTTSLPPNVDIDQAVQVVQAVRGAVVNMEMKANKVQRVLLTVTHNGSVLPERAPVMRDDGEFVAVSAQDGRIVMSDFKPAEGYTVRLPDGTSCKLSNIKLSDLTAGSAFQTGVAVCQ